MSRNREANPYGGLRAWQEGGAASAAAKTAKQRHAHAVLAITAMGEAKEEG
jgi:hypothetical protein